MALRRWKPFLAAFAHIDAAIESSCDDGLLSRDEFRATRARIVELMCDAAADNDKAAEGFCLLLDDAMAESLITLRATTTAQGKVLRRVLASGELFPAVGKLMREHDSERVRDLPRDVVRGWRAAVLEDLARATAAMDALDGLLLPPPPPSQDHTAAVPKKKTIDPNATGSISSTCKKMTAPVTGSCKGQVTVGEHIAAIHKDSAALAETEEDRMDATKRKLHDMHEEIKNAKRQRMIKVIKPPPQRCSRGRHVAGSLRSTLPRGTSLI